MRNSLNRFSNRVENYVKYRPDYPREILDCLRINCGLTRDSIIADIGCGTGISSQIFLENGNRVFGVEPNAPMREAAITFLSQYPDFIPVSGTAENTTLAGASVDLIVAAQAFHWFDAEKTRSEFRRILKPGGHIVLIWNERLLEATPFLREYEDLLIRYATDYGSVRHELVTPERLREFFKNEYGSAVFSNVQTFDLEGLTGRLLSSSYAPNEDDERFEPMLDELQTLFAKHDENGKINVSYDCKVYFSRI